VDGEDVESSDTVKVHTGFRKSLDSISRRLKELMLAAVAPGDDLSDYDVLVTGHSLGGALSTCFAMDVGEYGMDAGRGLPQLEPSEAWWSSIASTFGKKVKIGAPPPPPRPKSLKVYNFGSPRVGNTAFCRKFDSLVDDGSITEAYRIVNNQDIVARFPRSVNAGVLGNINYDHCGATVLITELGDQISKQQQNGGEQAMFNQKDMLWIEGESDDSACPVKDGNVLSDPLGSGSILGDIRDSLQQDESDEENEESSTFNLAKLGNIAEKVTGRLQNLSAEDVASAVGIDKRFTQREMKVMQSIVTGEGLTHHLEDKYYQGMGMSAGFVAMVGQELTPLDELGQRDIEEIISSESV